MGSVLASIGLYPRECCGQGHHEFGYELHESKSLTRVSDFKYSLSKSVISRVFLASIIQWRTLEIKALIPFPPQVGTSVQMNELDSKTCRVPLLALWVVLSLLSLGRQSYFITMIITFQKFYVLLKAWGGICQLPAASQISQSLTGMFCLAVWVSDCLCFHRRWRVPHTLLFLSSKFALKVFHEF